MSISYPIRVPMPFLALLLAACRAPDVPELEPWLTWDPAEPGPYAVGLRIETLDYEPAAGEPRSIGLNVWYPTEATDGAELSYLDAIPAEGFLGDAEPIVPVHPDGFPVVLYSHGDQAWGGSSDFLMAHFASHGWVAIAPDHTDNTLGDNVDPPPQGHWYHRPFDALASLDAVRDDPAFAIDDRRVLISGHSRGASTTTWSLAGATFDPTLVGTWCPECAAAQRRRFEEMRDPRIVAALNLAGWIRTTHYGDVGHRSAQIPFMVMTGTEDLEGDRDRFETLNRDVPMSWVELEGGCHQTFALGVCNTLDPDVGFSIVNTYALAYGRRHVLGDTTVGRWLDPGDQVHPSARLEESPE